ncbi:MAG TPA: hypothetical protein VJ233_13405, partial [Hyphomicrobiaceae bacterium]|nr:hypothetical protein [Hyphomicrobiaceae bacterium]
EFEHIGPKGVWSYFRAGLFVVMGQHEIPADVTHRFLIDITRSYEFLDEFMQGVDPAQMAIVQLK